MSITSYYYKVITTILLPVIALLLHPYLVFLLYYWLITKFQYPLLHIITKPLLPDNYQLLLCYYFIITLVLIHCYSIARYESRIVCITAWLLQIDFSLLHHYYVLITTSLCLHVYNITTNLTLNYYDWLFNYYMAPFQIYYFMITSITTSTTAFHYYITNLLPITPLLPLCISLTWRCSCSGGKPFQSLVCK